MKVVVDAMGGDHAPQVNVEGALAAVKEYGVELILVGDEIAVKKELGKWGKIPSQIHIQHAASVIQMHEPAAQSVRRKRDSSICIGVDLLKNGEADALVTAGHTGATVAAMSLKMRLLEGIQRPGIGIVFPTATDPSFLIDVGANIDVKSMHLYQYAAMGNIYMKYIMGKKNPSIGILNVGEEESKGTELIKEARQLLEESKLNFIGNVEGRDIFSGAVDVIVCEGFVGNVVLKVAESITDVISTLLKKELRKNLLAITGAFLARSAFNALKREVDYAEYGGAPLLGTNGTCIISHGSSNPKAIKNAIRVAMESVRGRINEHILQEVEFLETNSKE
jgi:phosphate acyltransferase